MINGFISGFVSAFANIPFQVIRTSMMVHERSELAKRVTMIQMAKTIYQQEGVLGFFRGFTPSLIRIPLGKAIYFVTLENTNQFLMNNFCLSEMNRNIISSACAMGVQCILTNPISLTSTRLEALGANKYSNIFEAFKVIHKEEGLIGFTKGLKALLLKEVPSHVIFYLLYRSTSKRLNTIGLFTRKVNYCVSALLSSTFVTILDNPFDIIRTRSQFQFISKNIDHLYPSITKALIGIYKTEGLRGLQNGVFPRIMRKIVSTTVLWSVYQMLKLPEEAKRNTKESKRVESF